METNNYLYTKEHYSSNRKPNNEKVLSELDDVIKDEVEPIVNKKAEEERKKYAYRYDVIKDCIEDHWKGEKKDLYKNDKDDFTKYTKVIYYEARLIEGLPIDNPTELSNLMCDIMANK